jgi:multidrug resistance efflux pump
MPIKDDQFVKKGDVLAKIGPSTYSIAVQSASTAVDLGAANAFPTGARLVTAEIADVEIEPR